MTTCRFWNFIFLSSMVTKVFVNIICNATLRVDLCLPNYKYFLDIFLLLLFVLFDIAASLIILWLSPGANRILLTHILCNRLAFILLNSCDDRKGLFFITINTIVGLFSHKNMWHGSSGWVLLADGLLGDVKLALWFGLWRHLLVRLDLHHLRRLLAWIARSKLYLRLV